MNVLLIGSGGREHALAWKLSQSELLEGLFISPGNPGTAQCGENVDLDIGDQEALSSFCSDKQIGMVVVGPEAPLVDGLRDRMKHDVRTSSIRFIGPGASGARLEGSKDFSKGFMLRQGIPTAGYRSFDSGQLQEGKRFLESLAPPYVLKADGLAAGKGVLILADLADAQASLEDMLSGSFGSASHTVVIEEFLHGTELSVFVLADGKSHLTLPSAKDYKRIGEGDTGLNTGGMGALSPAPVADDAFMQKVEDRIIRPTLDGLESEGIPYQGFLFIGLMRVGDDPYVIEYNVRMGDPETEVVLPRIQSDLLAHFIALSEGRLGEEEMTVSELSAATVMMVSNGYPEGYVKGKSIELSGSDSADQFLFHAGSKSTSDGLITSGGRVIASTGLGKTMEDALAKSYEGVERVKFEGKTFRRDIGYEVLKAELK